MRILANENLHMGIVQGLREVNYEVLFVPDLGLAGHKDLEILEYSEKNDMIVLQSSHNFGKIPSNSPLLKGRTHHHPPLKKGD